MAKKVIIVVDESHHTLAGSYRNTIKAIRTLRTKAKLLGLTATPVQANDTGSRQLLNMFDDVIVYDIAMSDLIVKKVLADPFFERIETNEVFESLIDTNEKMFLEEYKEFPESLAGKIASSNIRNGLIVDQYIKNSERYGKTLVFALNK